MGKDDSESKAKKDIGLYGAIAEVMLGDLTKQGRNQNINNKNTSTLLFK